MTKKKISVFLGLGLLVIAGISLSLTWSYQKNNLQPLNDEIDDFMNQQKVEIPKSKLEMQITILEKGINNLNIDSLSKKQLLKEVVILNKQIRELPEKNILPKDRFTIMKDMFTIKKDLKVAENAIFNTIFQGIGSLFFFLTVVISWRNYQETQEKEIVERLNKAFEDLESNKVVVKLGGIYILERIAAKSEKEHWTIMEVLTSFVRSMSTKEVNGNLKPITPVIQAVITTISRRNFKQDQENKPLDLSGSNLANADFRHFQRNKNRTKIAMFRKNTENIDSSLGSKLNKVNFRGAFFESADLRNTNMNNVDLRSANMNNADLGEANLDNADLSEANLDGADLSEIYLGGAKLIKASLRNANLYKANTRKDLPVKIVNFSQAILTKAKLTDARLTSAILSEANLSEANLCHAYLYGANFAKAQLIDTNFSDANLSNANLSEANLDGSILNNTDLFKTNLIGTKGLTPHQIKRAKNWEKAIYSKEFRADLGLALDDHI
jgi:uncharacterized protein YjbI with pentapeptide repeats